MLALNTPLRNYVQPKGLVVDFPDALMKNIDFEEKDSNQDNTENNVWQLTFLKYKGASLAISWGKGMHSTIQCLRCWANPITVSRNTTSFSCLANIIIRHFLKFRISVHTLSSTVLVADSCCQIKGKDRVARLKFHENKK